MRTTGRLASIFGRAAARRVGRPIGLASLCALALAAFLGTGAPAAAAAEPPCPNQAIREEQHSTYLPECRAYEMVSLAEKNSSQMGPPEFSADGESVLYSLLGSAPGSPSGFRSIFRAQRTPSGWESTNFLPPRSQMFAPNYEIGATTPDLRSALFTAYQSLGAFDSAPDTAVARLDSGQQRMLQEFPIFIPGPDGIADVASEDLNHVFVIVPYPIGDPSHQPETSNVYDIGSGTPELVSRMPATDQAPECGVPWAEHDGTIGFASSDLATRMSEHWASTDGSRAFFQSRGERVTEEVEIEPGVFETVDKGCIGPVELYMRNLTAGETTLVSGPPLAGDPNLGVDRFLQASPSGSVAFFRTATSFDPADDEDGNHEDMDIYKWTAASGRSVCITCAVPHANVDAPPIVGNNTLGQAVTEAIVSEDLSHVYFTSTEKLADAPSAASEQAPNLYVWRQGHSGVRFIARTDGIVNSGRNSGELTPDGNVLVFYSNQPSLNALTGTDNGGFAQYYRYDDRDGSVTCISCAPSGPTPAPALPGLAANAHSVEANFHALTADGDSIFFSTPNALVPGDTNGTYDIYEWHDGEVHLITSGTFDYAGQQPVLIGVTPSGRDLFFTDFEKHTPEVQESASTLYDARIGGGFQSPPTPAAPCASEEACHGTPGTSLPSFTPASDSPAGGGNVVESHSKPRKHHHKKRHHKRNAKHNRRTSR